MIWSFLTLWYLALVVIILHLPSVLLPSGLWRCWLGGRKGIRPVKTERWGAGMVICLECGADLHMAQLMLLPLTVSCFCKIQIGFTFLVPAHLGSPGKRAVKRVCVCIQVYFSVYSTINIYFYCMLLGTSWYWKNHKHIMSRKSSSGLCIPGCGAGT